MQPKAPVQNLRRLKISRSQTGLPQQIAANKNEGIDMKDVIGEKPTVPLDVPDKYRDRLQKLIDEFSDIFATSIKDLTRTTLLEHHIDVGDANPIALRPYKGNPIVNKKIHEYVTQLLEGGQVEPCTSGWSAPCTVVRKKDLKGSEGIPQDRFIIDYRKLNSVCINENFPGLDASTIFDKMHNKPFKSTLDFFSSFWQVPLSASSRPLTGFVTQSPQLHLQWTCSPMGQQGSTACFTRLITKVLEPMMEKSVHVFVDDILIANETEEEHWRDLRAVFDLLRKANLKLKLQKCEFFKESIKYLGHVISTEGISPDREKVDKILNYPTPRNAREVRQFLGISNFYKRYVKNHSKIAGPLIEKTMTTDLPFTWGKQEQDSFDQLRTILTSPVVMLHPRFDLPFILATDSSAHSLGAVLSQEQNGEVRPIAYASRRMKSEERRYCATDRELLSIIWGLKHFKHYFAFQKEPIIIENDHKALVWLASMKFDEGRIGRWSNFLAGFKYKICYKPGAQMGHADTLSRIPPHPKYPAIQEHDNSQGQQKERISINMVTGKKIEDMADFQRADPLCSKIQRYMDTGKLDAEDEIKHPIWVAEIDLYRMKDGTLYREITPPNRNHKILQIVAPSALRRKILEIMHGSTIGCHFAFKRTYARVAAKFYWPELRQNVEDFCKGCRACMLNREPDPKAFLKPQELATRPGMTVSIDIFGPVSPLSIDNSRYVLILIDKFSKYIKLSAMQDVTAATVAHHFLEEQVYRDGMPLFVNSDRGSVFTSTLWKEMTALLSGKQALTSSFAPTSNSSSERGFRIMKTQLKRLLVDRPHSDWSLFLGPIKMAYNDSIHSSTLQSPYYLNHGRDMSSPLNTALDIQPKTEGIYEDYISQLTDRLRYAFHKAREAMVKAREKQEKFYNKKADHDRIVVGSKVLLDKRVVKEGESRKFVPRYEGIYRVIRRYNNHTADISDNSYRVKRVHLNRLKLVLESELWRDRDFEKFDPTENIVRRFHNFASTQTLELPPTSKELIEEDSSSDQSDEEQTQEEVAKEEEEAPLVRRMFDHINWNEIVFEPLITHQIPISTSTNCKPQKVAKKKKRGRPKGSGKKRATAVHSAFKRPIGRPKIKKPKLKLTAKKVKLALTTTAVKRKPGRPKKNPTSTPPTSAQQQPVPAERRRVGRPRKIPIQPTTELIVTPNQESISLPIDTNQQATTANAESQRRVSLRRKRAN